MYGVYTASIIHTWRRSVYRDQVILLQNVFWTISVYNSVSHLPDPLIFNQIKHILTTCINTSRAGATNWAHEQKGKDICHVNCTPLPCTPVSLVLQGRVGGGGLYCTSDFLCLGGLRPLVEEVLNGFFRMMCCLRRYQTTCPQPGRAGC